MMRTAMVWAAVMAAMVAGCDFKPRPANQEPPAGAKTAEPAAGEPAPTEPAPAAGSGSGSAAGSGSGLAAGSGSAVAPTPALPAPTADEAAAIAAQRAKNPELFDRCTGAAQHTLDLMLAQTPDDQKAAAVAQAPKVLQSMRDECIGKGWSSELTTCITNAKGLDTLTKECQKLMPKPPGGP